MRWAALGVCVGAIGGCGGSHRVQPAAVVPTADGGQSDAALPIDAAPRVDVGATRSDGAPPDASADTTATRPGPPDWGTATQVPFSCDPMPNAFRFPRPGSDVPGAYARCASFADPRATSLAINADGTRVALIETDGVARIVAVASRTIVGVLAPPRASIARAVFSPSGDGILTVAPGERLATLWRADTFTPVWTTTFPGHSYQSYQGVAAFSPDGTAVLVSTGTGLYLLDAASGAIRATSAINDEILDAAYGWSGRRIALVHAPVTGMCVYSPHGGSVSLLDAATLATVATPVTWPMTSDETPEPGQMAVAADADLLVTTDVASPDKGVNAFRLSDGGALPAPQLTAFPRLLTPDGTAGLVARDGVLRLERVTDGVVVASTAAGAPSTTAISADGSAIAAGSRGAGLLAVWRPADGSWTPTCSAEEPADTVPVTTSLDATGATVAVGWGADIRLVRRADGALLSTIRRANQTPYQLTLSPDANYVLGEFIESPPTPVTPVLVLRTSDGAQALDVNGKQAYLGRAWSGFWFLPGMKRLDGAVFRAPSWVLVQFDLETGTESAGQPVDGLIQGLSGDCPLVAGPNLTLFRECDGAPPVPLATNTRGGLVSADGRFYLGQDAASGPQSAVLWDITSAPALIRTYPPRPEEASWDVDEAPLAISADGSRVITAVQRRSSCSGGAPAFAPRVHDVATDTTIDELPPYATAFSANLDVIAYGGVLWCAR